MRLFLIMAMLGLSGILPAQEVILDKSVNKDIFKTIHGPNTRKFWHLYFTFGTFFKTTSGQASVIYPGSLTFNFGFRSKYKIAEWYSIGYDLEYRLQNFRYHMPHDNLPKHEKDRIMTNDLAIDLFQRINIDKRGNFIGKFLDMGVYGELPFSQRNILIDKTDSAMYGKQKVILSKLKYMSVYNYGIVARIGYNRLVLYGAFRFSEVFRKSYNRAELPRLTLGIQIGLYR